MEHTHPKGASVDAINVSRGGQQYLPNGTDLTTIDNQCDPGRIAHIRNTRATRRPRRLLMTPIKPGFWLGWALPD
jgi:hypothetical protein